VSLRAVVGSVLVAGAAAVSADLVQAVVVVMVVVALAPRLPLVLLDFTVLILSTLVGPVHTCLHISKVASAGAHEVGRGHGLDLDEVGQLTDAGGVLTTLHAGVVTIMFMVGPVVGGVLDLHSPGGAVPQGVGGGLLAFVFRFAVDDSVAVTVAIGDGAHLVLMTLVHLVQTSWQTVVVVVTIVAVDEAAAVRAHGVSDGAEVDLGEGGANNGRGDESYKRVHVGIW